MPELTDAEIAERLATEVMGWVKWSHYVDGLGSRWFWCDTQKQVMVDYWKPLTNIEQAMMVAEKLRQRGYSLELYSPQALISDEFSVFAQAWVASLQDWRLLLLPNDASDEEYEALRQVDNRRGDGEADTPARAICLAALATLEAPDA